LGERIRAMLRLPIVAQNTFDIRPIDWSGLPQTYLNRGELEIIVALVISVTPQIMVEIGLAEGRTAKAILRATPTLARYIGVDTTPDYRPKLCSQWTERSIEPGYLAIDDPRFERMLLPRGSLDLVADDFPPIDAVFVDGDHSSEVVRHDSDLARAIVRPGGIIIWHDYHNNGVEVTRVLDLDHSLGCDIRNIENTWLAYERR
jgi:predicted O-methyltransferase YrrM